MRCQFDCVARYVLNNKYNNDDDDDDEVTSAVDGTCGFKATPYRVFKSKHRKHVSSPITLISVVLQSSLRKKHRSLVML